MLSTNLIIGALLGCVSASVKLVTNSSDEIYIENDSRDGKVGYSFALFQNVLTVELNGTVPVCCNKASTPASLVIMPNLLMEFNGTVNANSTTSVYGFLDKANNNTDWGTGLSAVKSQSKGSSGNSNVDVWTVTGEWKNREGGKPKFRAQMYFSSAPTTYQNMSLDAHSILVRYSILEFPYKLRNSSVGYEQIVLSRTAADNVTISQLTDGTTDGLVTYLRVNETAIVDGQPQSVSIGNLNVTGESLSITAGNSTRLNITEYEVGSLFLSFSNSSQAKNITFDQRLALNISELRSHNDVTAQNSASKAGPLSPWAQLTVAISALALAFTAFVL